MPVDSSGAILSSHHITALRWFGNNNVDNSDVVVFLFYQKHDCFKNETLILYLIMAVLQPRKLFRLGVDGFQNEPE